MRFIALVFFVFMVSCSNDSEKTDKNPLTILKDTTSAKPKPTIISDVTNTLENKVQDMELEFIIWDCSCANWIKTGDRAKYYTKEKLQTHCMYIEPADATLKLPDSAFQFDRNNIKVTGRFYVKEDYPQGTVAIEEPQVKAKVFRYTKIEIINKKYVVN
jgi:hypothetical protein